MVASLHWSFFFRECCIVEVAILKDFLHVRGTNSNRCQTSYACLVPSQAILVHDNCMMENKPTLLVVIVKSTVHQHTNKLVGLLYICVMTKQHKKKKSWIGHYVDEKHI